MAMKVHGSMISTPTLRVMVCLNEKSLDYDFVAVNLGAGDHKKDPFLSLNPFGQIPAFEDGDLKLFESRAITQYIAHAYAGKGTPLVSKDPKEAATVEVWAEVEAQRYEPPASKLTWELGIKPMLGMPTDDVVVAEQEAELAKFLMCTKLVSPTQNTWPAPPSLWQTSTTSPPSNTCWQCQLRQSSTLAPM